MKQVLQNIGKGDTMLSDVPVPILERGKLFIRSGRSLISSGTERMLIEFGKANLYEKARQQPDKVRMVLDKVRSDGLAATLDAVQSKLDQPLALGYCNVGRVESLGTGVDGFAPGDRVVSNGPHAEYVCVPRNLCARIPDNVDDDCAAFTVLAAIGLQGIRLAAPTAGECVVVIGLGVIGLLTVQLLLAQGCRVLGVDLDDERLALAAGFGAEVVHGADGDAVLRKAGVFSRNRGVDAVLITASSSSNEPVRQAAQMSRKRGRIVLVGVVGLELSRADFYEKELSFQVSCSYGPGRYDPAYEQRGQDYPLAYVRWTEQRNFEAVLDLMAAGRIDPRPLISHHFALEDATAAYALLASDEPSMGILLNYPATAAAASRSVRLAAPAEPLQGTAGKSPAIAFLGAGNYAGRILMPAFKATGAQLHTVVSRTGVSATHTGRKYGFVQASTDSNQVFQDPEVDAVVIATRHDAHATQVIAALQAGKHVFCEKPLCLTLEELASIEREARARPQQGLMVGFNRRFAPLTQRMHALLATRSAPMQLNMVVNAGALPRDHWTQQRDVGGGRLIGEACHFIDLARYLAGVPISGAQATALGNGGQRQTDNATLVLSFSDGSVACIQYLANGHRALPKERIEVFCEGRILQLDNFRSLRGWGWPGFSRQRLWRQDKGQIACARAFVESLERGSPSPIPLDEILEVSRIAIELDAALQGA